VAQQHAHLLPTFPSICSTRRIIELHRKRQNDFAAERARRMAQVDQRKEQEERAALERQQSEDRLKQTAELHKKEYTEKLAQEVRCVLTVRSACVVRSSGGASMAWVDRLRLEMPAICTSRASYSD
jgi:hypothetical protein